MNSNPPDIRVAEVVARNIDGVWESWADFKGIHKFHDDVLAVEILSNMDTGVGAERLCWLADRRNSIVEKITAWEPRACLAVEFVRTTLPIRKATAKFRFHAVSSDATRVEMLVWFEMSGWLAPVIKPFAQKKMRDGFSRLLASNKRFLESR